MISPAKLWLACLLGTILCLAACAANPSAPISVRQVVSTTSFGMCAGYCTTRLEISAGQAVLVREARGGRGAQDLPTQRIPEALSASDWEEIARLAANADLTGLPPVIGCPDCADGGAESLTIERSGASQSVAFEYGAAIPQAQALLERVRALRARMAAE